MNQSYESLQDDSVLYQPTKSGVDPLTEFGKTASVYISAKQKNQLLSLDKYKAKNSGVGQKLQDLVFEEKVAEFKKKVGFTQL